MRACEGRFLIHPQAIVSSDARVADGAEIGAYSVIGDEVEIGAGTTIGPHVVIKGPTRIGRDNHIFQFASIGDDPQDKKYAGESTRLEIGDRNTIREGCTINRGTVQDDGVTRLGSDNWLMAYVHVAHDCQIGDHTVLANCATLAGHVELGDFAIMGGFTGVHQYCRIGSHSFLGMYAGITQDVPPYVMVSGRPAEPKGINLEGLKRREYSPEQIRHIRSAYKILYRSGLKLSEALERLETSTDEQPELRLLVDFLRSSKRGIIR